MSEIKNKRKRVKKNRSKRRTILKFIKGGKIYFITAIAIILSYFIARSLPSAVNRYLYGSYQIRDFYQPKDIARQEYVLNNDLQDIKRTLDELKKR